MTYDAIERSADQARPVELYTFARGAVLYRYTSANEDRVVSFQTFVSAPIERSEIEQGAEINRSGLTITVPRDFVIARMWMIAPPSEVVALTLQQYHEGDGDLAAVWSGRVLGVSFQGARATISLEPIGTSIRRNGLRRPWQTLCPRVLGTQGCNVNLEAYKVTGPIDTVVGLTLTADELGAKPDGWFAGGCMRYSIPGGLIESRDIVSHTGTSVELDMTPLSLAAGTIADFFPGCDCTLGANGCGKFSNEPNFGGEPYIPKKNPFGNDPLY